MKKFILTLFFFSCALNFVNAQKIYTNKNDYESAIKKYNYDLEAYSNFVRKYNFYKNFNGFPSADKFPRTEYGWLEFIKPHFEKENIIFDTEQVKSFPNVKPKSLIHVNFYKSSIPNKNIYMTFTPDSKIDDPLCLYSVSFYTYENPGKKPLFSEPVKMKKPEKTIDSSLVVVNKETTQIINVLEVPAVPLKEDVYFMPDGTKYNSYDQLIYHHPSLANKIVFNNNFKNNYYDR